MTVKMMAKLPKDAGDNGLIAIEQALVEDVTNGAGETWLVVAMIKAKRLTVEDDGSHTPTAHVVHIEVLAGPERGQADKLLRERHAQRTGNETLPFEMIEAGDGDGDGED